MVNENCLVRISMRGRECRDNLLIIFCRSCGMVSRHFGSRQVRFRAIPLKEAHEGRAQTHPDDDRNGHTSEHGQKDSASVFLLSFDDHGKA